MRYRNPNDMSHPACPTSMSHGVDEPLERKAKVHTSIRLKEEDKDLLDNNFGGVQKFIDLALLICKSILGRQKKDSKDTEVEVK